MLSGLILSLIITSIGVKETLYLNLEQTLRLALKKSPLAIEADAEQNQGILMLGKGAAGVLPRGSASVSHLNTDAGSIWQGELAISQVIFDPIVFNGLISSILNADYYSLAAREKTAQLIFAVTSDYLNLLRAHKMLTAAQRTVEQTQANYRLIGERFRLGQVSKIELLRSQSSYQQAELNLLSAEKNYANAISELRTRVGITSEQVLVPIETLDTIFPEVEPESLLKQIERYNPGVGMSRKMSRIASLNLVAVILKILPSISWFSSSRYIDTVLPQNRQHWQNKAEKNEGITITLPVTDLLNFILSIGEALVQVRRSQAEFTRARLELRAAAERAIYGYQEARRRYQQAKKNLELNQELYELAQYQFRLGGLGLSQLLEIESGLAQAEAGAVAALSDVYTQLAQIGYLMGITRAGKEK